MKIIITILTLTVLVSCSEEQVFDISFKENERYYLAGYCEPTDSSCTANVNKYFDVCFEESDYDPAILSSISHVDWTKPQEAQKTMENTDFSKMNEFKELLNNCMANNIGGSFAKNLKQGNSSWESDVKITRSTNQAKFSPKKNSSILITIKDNGDIWLNKNTVKIKDLKSMVKDLTNKNPDLYAVIIADRNSSTSDLVRVMDQLKSAGIENISIAATKPN